MSDKPQAITGAVKIDLSKCIVGGAKPLQAAGKPLPKETHVEGFEASDEVPIVDPEVLPPGPVCDDPKQNVARGDTTKIQHCFVLLSDGTVLTFAGPAYLNPENEKRKVRGITFSLPTDLPKEARFAEVPSSSVKFGDPD